MAYKGGLRKWFKEDWRDVSTGKPCGRKSATKESGRSYPACRPKAVASTMSASEKKRMTSKKRSSGKPKAGKPTNIKWSTTPSGRKRKSK
mgnify:CR=1 FL=1